MTKKMIILIFNLYFLLLQLWRYNFALRRWTLEQTTGDGPTLTLASHSSKLIIFICCSSVIDVF